jgi:hypothetical protein
MTKNDWSAFDEMKRVLEEFDRQMKESERVRGQIESQMRRKPGLEERRIPKRWQRMPDPDPDNSTEA